MLSKNLTIAVLVALLLILLLGCAEDDEAPVETVLPPPETSALTPQEIAEITLKSFVVLNIKKTNNKWLKPVSGFVVSGSQIATVYHVVDDVDAGTARGIVEVIQHPIESVVAIDEAYDLAILRANGISAPPLPLGNSNEVRIGEPVHVTGNPDGYIGSFLLGLLVAYGKATNSWRIR